MSDVAETFVDYDPACGTIAARPDDLGNWERICAASCAGHPCVLDSDDLNHFPESWPDDKPWLLGVTHRCGCSEPVEWPEVY